MKELRRRVANDASRLSGRVAGSSCDRLEKKDRNAEC